MLRYIGKRILWMIPVILGVLLIVFGLSEIAPGDPVDQIVGFDAPEEIKEAKSGPVLSYLKDKKVLLNYVYRKSGIKVRLYAAGISKYEERLADLPDKMKAELIKATDCKKLNGLSCTPTCPGGYTYSLDGEVLKKCRSMAFLMTLNPKTAEYIQNLVICEARER